MRVGRVGRVVGAVGCGVDLDLDADFDLDLETVLPAAASAALSTCFFGLLVDVFEPDCSGGTICCSCSPM
jgi:hypothetical protein